MSLVLRGLRPAPANKTQNSETVGGLSVSLSLPPMSARGLHSVSRLAREGVGILRRSVRVPMASLGPALTGGYDAP